MLRNYCQPGETMTHRHPPTHYSDRRAWRAPLAVMAGAIVVGGIIVTVLLTTSSDDDGTTSSTDAHPAAGALFATTNPLADASMTCDAGTLADEDDTLLVDMAGEDPGTGEATYDDVRCVLAELEAPQSLTARMGSTRALDGMQSATWSTYEVTWNYHPDDGLDLIITHNG
jgi:hypothetical protein